METIYDAGRRVFEAARWDTLQVGNTDDCIEMFEAGVQFAQRWIPVEEELPEIDESGESDLILMKIDHFIYVGNYTEDGEWVELTTREKYTPTHWRQIELK